MSLWEVLEPGVLRSPPDAQPCSTAQASPTPAAWHCPEVWSVSGEGGPPGPLRAGPRETRGEDDVETEEARLPRSHGAGPWTQDDPPTCAQTSATPREVEKVLEDPPGRELGGRLGRVEEALRLERWGHTVFPEPAPQGILPRAGGLQTCQDKRPGWPRGKQHRRPLPQTGRAPGRGARPRRFEWKDPERRGRRLAGPEASSRPPHPAPETCGGRGAASPALVPAMEVLRRSSVLAAEIMDAFDRSPTDKELVAQAKALGREFVHARLLRAGLSWSAPERAAPVPGGRLAEVCAVLLRLADELELIRPSVYRNVARQLNLSLQSETVVTDAFLAVATQIFSAGITWGKVVSLYSVAAGLAVDCVRQAQPALVHALVDCLGEFVRKTLATWLRRRGGWTDVLKCVVSTDPGLRSHWLVAALCSFGRFLKAAFFMLLPER
ncbi:hypothetical protein AB1E18_001657 [Capra hircus]